MPEHIATLIVILTIATTIFVVGKKHLEPLLPPGEFVRWRNAWIIITLIAFLASNFWLYLIATGFYVNRAIKKTDHRFAFVLAILFAVPPISVRLGPLFAIDYVRLLSLIIFLPMFLSVRDREDTPRLGQTFADWLVILLITLMTLLEMRGTTVTDALRNGVGYGLAIFLPYFVASRSLKDFNQLKIAMIGLTLAGIIAGSIAVFEFAKGWLLYQPLPHVLNMPFDLGKYLGRDGFLRALSSLGQPLILGLVMVITFGFYLFVGSLIKNKWIRRLCLLAILAGLYVPLSRGSWIAAIVLIIIFLALGPQVIKKMSVALIFAVIIGSLLPVIPGGQKIINLLPFVGKVDPFNVDYREVLFDKSIEIVKRKPLFGVSDPSKEPEMEDMVQGEGIVDIVNSYLNIVLGYGIPALILYVGLFVLAIFRVNSSRKKIKDRNSEEYLCGRALIATMIAVMIAISSVSGIGIIPTVIYTLVGLMLSYARIIDNTYKKKFSWK